MGTALFFIGGGSGGATFKGIDFEFLPELTSQQQQQQPPPSTSTAATASTTTTPTRVWVLLELEQAVACPSDAVFIGSHLDAAIDKNACRLAFHGSVAEAFQSAEAAKGQLRVFRRRAKEGVVDRVVDGRTAIIRGLCKREASPGLYAGLVVTFPEIDGLSARIEAPFGKSGKFKVVLSRDVAPAAQLASKKVRLAFKKFMFRTSPSGSFIQ
jgi:hypothetical protein